MSNKTNGLSAHMVFGKSGEIYHTAITQINCRCSAHTLHSGCFRFATLAIYSDHVLPVWFHEFVIVGPSADSRILSFVSSIHKMIFCHSHHVTRRAQMIFLALWRSTGKCAARKSTRTTLFCVTGTLNDVVVCDRNVGPSFKVISTTGGLPRIALFSA